MPELPEVEVICRGLMPHLVGRTIMKVVFSNRRLRLPVPRGLLKLWIQGGKVEAVSRRAKYLLISMSNGAAMVLHMGMTGRLTFSANGAPRAPHDHLRFFLNDNKELRFNDVRRFGSVQVLRPDEVQQPRIFANLGLEPLGADFSADYLMDLARGRVKPVKNFLMDGSVVVGIGNIYVNEILFAAGIRPERAVGKLEKNAWERVVQACRQVLEQAIACGGTTISDYVNSSGEPGYFHCELKVYGRGGKPCQSCGSSIARRVIAGRATYFCVICQR